MNINTIFREEATSALNGFHAGPLSWLNWNFGCLWREENRSWKLNWNLVKLECGVFVEGGKRRTRGKTLTARTRTNNKLNPHMTSGPYWTRVTLVEGERIHHCAIPWFLFFRKVGRWWKSEKFHLGYKHNFVLKHCTLCTFGKILFLYFGNTVVVSG